ncbi:MAG TPA: LLM class flavin-dependent oxidoreductase [Candidatus Binatia bacterium]|nr:LLM class flavin-dependent oxidoreductase [Candidatus Binatia bacterium]
MAELGVMIEAQEGLTWERWRGIVADTERLGFASLRVSDHCQSVFGVEGRESLHAWMALALAAEWTERVQLAPMVSPLTFYEPGVLARMAIAVDQLSGGRLLLGVGTGWNAAEHETFGIPFPDLGPRFDRLERGIELIERLNAEIPGARRLPLLIGGSGERRTLPLAARHAAEWNVHGVSPDEFRAKSAVLDRACAEAGRDPGEIRRSMMTSVIVGRTRDDLRERAARLARFLPPLAGLEPDEVIEQLGQRWPAGTPDEIVARLRPFADAGVQTFLIQHFLLDDPEELEILAQDVVPTLA